MERDQSPPLSISPYVSLSPSLSSDHFSSAAQSREPLFAIALSTSRLQQCLDVYFSFAQYQVLSLSLYHNYADCICLFPILSLSCLSKVGNPNEATLTHPPGTRIRTDMQISLICRFLPEYGAAFCRMHDKYCTLQGVRPGIADWYIVHIVATEVIPMCCIEEVKGFQKNQVASAPAPFWSRSSSYVTILSCYNIIGVQTFKS
jgi:hypothetical protein